jgi:hypothetical protein
MSLGVRVWRNKLATDTEIYWDLFVSLNQMREGEDAIWSAITYSFDPADSADPWTLSGETAGDETNPAESDFGYVDLSGVDSDTQSAHAIRISLSNSGCSDDTDGCAWHYASFRYRLLQRVPILLENDDEYNFDASDAESYSEIVRQKAFKSGGNNSALHAKRGLYMVWPMHSGLKVDYLVVIDNIEYRCGPNGQLRVTDPATLSFAFTSVPWGSAEPSGRPELEYYTA